MAVTVQDLVTMGALLSTDNLLPDGPMQRKLNAAVALVERYAPDAPVDVKDEATIRAVGWMLDRSPAASHVEIGDTETHYAVSAVNVLFHSGASGLLAPWRAHTLGKVDS